MKIRHSLRFRRPGSSRSELARYENGMSSLLPKCTDFEQLPLWRFGHSIHSRHLVREPRERSAETSSFDVDSISSVGR